MEELLPFLQKYEVWVYLLLGVIAFFYLQKLVMAWRQWQGTVFGLEREIAQRRFSTALTVLVLLMVFVFLEFIIVSFVAPSYPQASALPTATLDLLATPTVTLPALAVNAVTVVAPVETTPNVEEQTLQEGCTAGQIEWVSPKAGEEISATVELKGTVNVPSLGFYKYEFAGTSEEVWTTIAAGNQPKVEGIIGYWNTSQLASGDYRLRLVVADHQSQLFPACVISVKVKGQP